MYSAGKNKDAQSFVTSLLNIGPCASRKKSQGRFVNGLNFEFIS
jgi:hypothetical protein